MKQNSVASAAVLIRGRWLSEVTPNELLTTVIPEDFFSLLKAALLTLLCRQQDHRKLAKNNNVAGRKFIVQMESDDYLKRLSVGCI